MKNLIKLTSVLLLIEMLMLLFCSCEPSSATKTEPGKKSTVINIIYTQGNYSTAYAAAEAISNEYETYVMTAMGTVLCGIDSLEKFHNIGFDPNTNKEKFTKEDFDLVIAKVAELNKQNKKAFFNFYCQDGTALTCVAIAANAGIKESNFHVYMIENENGFNKFMPDYTDNSFYHERSSEFQFLVKLLRGSSLTPKKDGIYERYVARLNELTEDFDKIMKTTDNRFTESMNCSEPVEVTDEKGQIKTVTYPHETGEQLSYNVSNAYHLACHKNFSYRLADDEAYRYYFQTFGKLKTRLETLMGLAEEPLEVDYTMKVTYESLSARINRLEDDKKLQYYTLLFGDNASDIRDELYKTDREGKQVPINKQIFFGCELSKYPRFASDEKHGIGGLDEGGILPKSYDELDAKYKNEYLFNTEEDYNLFLSVVNDPTSGFGESEKARIACFNYYIDYIFAVKHTYFTYGKYYDVIVLGSENEPISGNSDWTESYRITDGNEIILDTALRSLINAFHSSESFGRYIGIIPSNILYKNLATTVENISVGGIDYARFSEMDPDVNARFFMVDTTKGTFEFFTTDDTYLQKYMYGRIGFSRDNDDIGAEDSHGVHGRENLCIITYMFSGNVYKYIAKNFEDMGNTEMKQKYELLMKDWIKAWCKENNKTYIDAYYITESGAIHVRK